MFRILTCDSLVVKCLSCKSPQPAVSQSCPYEGAIITFIICTSLIILALIIRNYFKAQLNKKDKEEPVTADNEKTRLYAALIEKKLDYEQKLTDKDFFAKVNGENAKIYIASLNEAIEAAKPNDN